MLYFVIDNHDKELGYFNSFGRATLFMLECWERGYHDMNIIQATSKKQFKKIIRKNIKKLLTK